MPSQIPIIDIAALTTTTNPASQLSTAKSLVTACQQVGFAYITNHNLSPTLLEEAFNTSKALYALPHEAKMQAPHPAGPAVHRGYSHPGQEKVSQYAGGREDIGEALREVADCKESYEIGSEDNEEQPNVWLPEETLPGFKESILEFYWRCNEVAQIVLRTLALGIGLEDVAGLTGHHSGLNNQLRLLHYPPVAAAELESGRVSRMPAHSDWSSITLLFQDECGGLEVEHPHRPGEFIAATPIEGACVVNVGDLLMRWSNDTLKSTLHRVTLPPLADRIVGEERMTHERYSIVYFVSADPDAVVECLPVCVDEERPARYEPITQREYSQMRSKVQYRDT